jgi:hypothetical protein
VVLFNAFLLILWSGGVSYVRPFYGGMAASGSVSLSIPLAKMLQDWGPEYAKASPWLAGCRLEGRRIPAGPLARRLDESLTKALPMSMVGRIKGFYGPVNI